jgi:DNA-binding MarR family transcriptional regulator
MQVTCAKSRSDVDRPDLPLIAVLRRISQSIVDDLVARLQAAGYADITAAHHPVFYHLDPGGTRLTELAARAGMTHQSMGELVTGLAALGYVDRRPDPADGRARLVVLTARGEHAVRRARAEVARIEQAWQQRYEQAGGTTDLRQTLTQALTSATPE